MSDQALSNRVTLIEPHDGEPRWIVAVQSEAETTKTYFATKGFAEQFAQSRRARLLATLEHPRSPLEVPSVSATGRKPQA